MATMRCEECGHDLAATGETCPNCGHALNGVAGSSAAPHSQKLPPELLEWARKTFNEEEFLAGIREIRETGGLEFEDFLKELERAAGEHE